jgi:hypothetical protein
VTSRFDQKLRGAWYWFVVDYRFVTQPTALVRVDNAVEVDSYRQLAHANQALLAMVLIVETDTP